MAIESVILEIRTGMKSLEAMEIERLISTYPSFNNLIVFEFDAKPL